MPDIYKEMSIQEQMAFEGGEGSEVGKVDTYGPLLVYLRGYQYPLKGLPTREAIWATNIVKKLLLTPMLPSKFAFVAGYVIKPYLLKTEHQTKVTQQLIFLLTTLFKELAIGKASTLAWTIAHIFEYDAAYRLRLQDLMNESSTQKLLDNPHKEIKRFLEINRQRDYNVVSRKFAKVAWLIRVALWVPRFRYAFKIAIRTWGIEGLKPDENDTYWMCQKVDYNYFGKTFDERQELAKSL